MLSPIQTINSLLQKDTIDNVWKKLIITHAQTYKSNTYNILKQQPEFIHIQPYDNDILQNLSVGQISVLYEYSLATVNKTSRKQSGQYFTPDDVSNFMAAQSVNFPDGIWLDPCVGVGNLSYWIVEKHSNPEKFLSTKLKIADKDPLALLIATSLLFLKFHSSNNNLFNNIKNNSYVLDFLKGDIPSHDYVIANPPYAKTLPDNNFLTSETRDLYGYFLENITKTSKGFITVTPQSFTNSSKFKKLRNLLIQKYNKITVMCFDNIPDSIFKGYKHGSDNTNTANSVRAAIMVAQTSDSQEHKITPLLRWRSQDRSILFENIKNKLSETFFTEETWLKQYKQLLPLYNKTKKWKPLEYYISSKETPYYLTIPTTPRYYISATMKDLQRSSYRKIFFETAELRDKLFIYLNSSIPYWWWRLNDGGMTLSKETIYNIPVMPNVVFNNELYQKLLKSEQLNSVTKLNAGKINENVKHPKHLLEEINTFLVGEKTTEKLMKLHMNTDIV